MQLPRRICGPALKAGRRGGQFGGAQKRLRPAERALHFRHVRPESVEAESDIASVFRQAESSLHFAPESVEILGKRAETQFHFRVYGVPF